MSNKDLSEIVQELKSAICASEARILLKIENYNERIKTFEFENTGLKRSIENLERNLKKNNLVIFGLNLTPEEVSVQNKCNKLNTILETNLNSSVISDLYLLGGNTGKEPIKLELLSRFTKFEILST
ncbi:unnamed protein product [Psylliodes chrysocephalus]|uniref:Uncharacterized protein n=1 Tax=Psylliodes chrysocephalus TaxID=3402493 RepID=A0A9P0G8Y3_9CUCU|nr:unnamed protein product [Psylliodes chrysocephala]